MNEVKVVVAASAANLEQMLNAQLAKGWDLHGPLTIGPKDLFYVQMLSRVKVEETAQPVPMRECRIVWTIQAAKGSGEWFEATEKNIELLNTRIADSRYGAGTHHLEYRDSVYRIPTDADACKRPMVDVRDTEDDPWERRTLLAVVSDDEFPFIGLYEGRDVPYRYARIRMEQP